MNFYRKINKYILERFPTMWNTQFVWMVLICLLTHLLYFGLGYSSLNIDVLKKYGVDSLFFSSGFFSFYIIIGILVLIFFAFRYYAHNPFRHFYPLSQTYFWKIFSQLFIIFLLFGTVFISFENGARLKAKKIAPIEIVTEEANKVNMAKPFMFNAIEDYNISKRSYPDPFPFEDIKNITIGYDSINGVVRKYGTDYKQPYITLNGTDYQFGTKKEIRIDSCTTDIVLDKIYDVSKIYGISEYSLYNYSDFETRKRKYIDNDDDFMPEENGYDNLALIHKWYQAKDSQAIAKTIQALKDICTKYKISEQLYPQKMANAILKQDLNKQELVRVGFYDYKKNIASDFDNSAPGIDDNNSGKGKSFREIEYNYSVNITAFESLKNNVSTLKNRMGTNHILALELWIVLTVSLAFAMFLIMVKYIPLKDLIIGIFVAAVLATILTLFFTISNIYREKATLSISIIYAALIILVGLYGLFTKGIRKQLLTKWFIALVIAILGIFPMAWYFIRQSTAKEVYQKCQIYSDTVYLFEFKPWHFIVMELVATFIIFRLLRKLHGKAE